MCCADYMRRLIRIVKATEVRRFSNWQAEVWFKSVVDASNGLTPMPEANYDASSTLQNYFSIAISSGLQVYQSHSLATPTERGDPPCPTGALLPAPAKPISPGLPMPKAVSVDASAEQGGEDPPRSSLLFPSQEIGSRQRSDVPADQGATTSVGFVPVIGQEDGGLNTIAVMERDAELEELRQQVQALQAQAAVQTSSAQSSVFGQTRPGVIPSRDQSGLLSKAVLRSKAPLLGCQK